MFCILVKGNRVTASRLAALRTTFDGAEIDGLLVINEQNRRYLSGFTGSAGVLIIDQTRAILVTDGRYTDQATEEAAGFEVVIRGLDETLVQCVARLVPPITRVGFESATLTYADHADYARQLGDAVRLVPISDLTEGLRTIKDATELATLRRAIAITDGALAQVRPLLRPTMREREVAWELHKAIIELGGDGLAFDIIVAAGRNSARPHYRAGTAELGSGQPIVIDFGALLAGYHADMTRTLILGEPDAKFREIYGVVRQALEQTTRGLQPGITGQAADALARDVIAAAGYGDYFTHGLGHGVRMNPAALPLNSVFSVEPGIYLPDWGGVRLENLVYFTAQGAETLSQSPFEFGETA
jgi:Xaa-Pro aminopeptidase